jgi:hypothetical protein
MGEFERQLLELDDFDMYERNTNNNNSIEENLAELGTLLMKIFSNVTKKKLLVEDTSIVNEKQQQCIMIMKEILRYIEK